jgi:hypothetical protein
MVSQLHSLGERADRRLSIGRQPFYGEQQLMLLRLDAGGPCGRFAEADKAADLIAEFRHGDIKSTTYKARGLSKEVATDAPTCSRCSKVQAVQSLPSLHGGLSGGFAGMVGCLWRSRRIKNSSAHYGDKINFQFSIFNFPFPSLR